jgi:hypothetical protein
MKKIINFLKTLIFGRTSAWVDVEVSAAKRAEAPTIRIGWCIPKMEDLNTTLVNGEVTVAYLCDKNVINVTHIINGETVLESELTITSRIFTKVNNVLKKSDVEPITMLKVRVRKHIVTYAILQRRLNKHSRHERVNYVNSCHR